MSTLNESVNNNVTLDVRSESESGFTRHNIEAIGNTVNIVDSDEDNKLDMFCYVTCSNEDSELQKQCRGVVFNKDTLIMKAFPYTPEYNHTQLDEIKNELGDLKKWHFYESHEGCLIRMFYFNGKWYISTHRKLNAFRSKWSSKDSFGMMFKNALLSEEENNNVFAMGLQAGDNIVQRFESTLDVHKQYMFVVRNNDENRIVCSAPDRPTLYHAGTFVNGNLVFTENVNIPFSTKKEFLTVNELIECVQNISAKNLQGIIGFTSDNKQVKIVSEEYQSLFKIRGNEPSLKFRYLQLRMNKNVQLLYMLYPNMVNTFNDYEDSLFHIAQYIYNSYVDRFIKKTFVTVPREEFGIIRECHSWHIKDRGNNRISRDYVINELNRQSPTNLNRMIKRFKMSQNNPVGRIL